MLSLAAVGAKLYTSRMHRHLSPAASARYGTEPAMYKESRSLKRFLPLVLVAASIYSGAAPIERANSQVTQSDAASSAQADVAALRHQLEIVQRDQLNYKIEKDLLKEAYSSNLQSVNLVITIVFGIFAVLGYAGMRSIKEIRTDYRAELDKLKELKGSFEKELDSLRAKQRDFELSVAELTRTNDAQDRRLKVMEIIEKVGSLIGNRAYGWALEHISIGLSLDPKNAILLAQQAQCYGKQGQLGAAISSSRKLLEVEPDNIGHITNLCEYLALAGDKAAFESYYQKYASQIESGAEGALSAYLKVVALTTTASIDQARSFLADFAKQQSPEPKARLDNWSFDDAIAATRGMPANSQKDLLMTIVRYFRGELSSPDLLTTLSAQSASPH